MKNENINSTELPKEIKADNENTNPLLDIISSIQEKLDIANNNNNNLDNKVNSSNTYTNPSHNFNFENNNMNMGFNSNNPNSASTGFDTSKLFEMLGNISGNNQKTTSSASNPFANLDMDTMMRLGKIFTSNMKGDNTGAWQVKTRNNGLELVDILHKDEITENFNLYSIVKADFTEKNDW